MSLTVSPASSLQHATTLAGARDLAEPRMSAEEREARDVFQQFVAGTFFQQMFKSLRKTQGKAHYLHGGQTEEIFQAQFDQHVADELAKRHGDALCRTMVEPFLQQLRARLDQPQQPAAMLDRMA